MNVTEALANTSVGKLIYDRNWAAEGRIKEILENVSQFSTNVSLNKSLTLSPKSLAEALNQNVKDASEDNSWREISPTKQYSTKAREKPERNDNYFYTLQTESELRILEYEEERLKYLEDIFNSKKDEFEKFSKSIEQQRDQQYYLLRRNIELNEKKKVANLQNLEETILAEAKKKELLQKEQLQSQAKKLSAIVQEAELKQKKAEEEFQKRQQEQQEFVQQLTNCKLEVAKVASKIKLKLEAVEYPSYLKISVSERLNQLSAFLANIHSIAGSQPLTIEDVSSAYAVVKGAYEFSQEVNNDLESAKTSALHVQDKNILEPKTVPSTKENTQISHGYPVSCPTEDVDFYEQKGEGAEERTKKKIANEAKSFLSTFIASDVVGEYHRIKENLKVVNQSIKKFVEDPKNKKYRFELQKSINVPINAISSVSGSHVRDKINKLLSILTSIKTSNWNSSVVYNFCADLIAKKLVEQGDKQISAQYSTAFPIALVVVGIWQKKPEIGSLILGHFYSNCPYLVPYYPQPREGQSDEDYHKSLGYCFDREGNLEAKYKFLNRMSGFMRLYAAVIISPLPPSPVKQPHPHGIAYGWRWLARCLNLEPRPDITATLLYDFLDVTGNSLQRTYGEQFKKLLHIICKDYFPKIKRVTPIGSSGPIERLETFLQQAMRKGSVLPPDGVLDTSFWSRM